MAEPDVLPRVLSGRFRLEATLGQGGMGVVYRGTDLATKRPIAVKLVRFVDGVPLDEEVAGRFLREAKHTARVQHEHIVEVVDLGRTDNFGLYFVMELLEGESLAQRLKREGKLSPTKTVHIARQMCEALQVAHSAGVIHRDLKPANIMLLPRPGHPDFVKVLDFGVAKSFGPDRNDETQLTHTGMLVGTLDYMAPEQIMGKPVDGRTDIYSLGVMLYRMLAGKPPFVDLGVPQLIHAHMNTLPKPLMEVASGIPNALDLVVLRCMAKNPDRRFDSMAELARALTHAIDPEALELGPSPSDADVYDDGDKTRVGRSLLEPPAARPLPVLNDVTLSGTYEDATVQMERAAPVPKGPVVPPPLQSTARGGRGQTAKPPPLVAPPPQVTARHPPEPLDATIALPPPPSAPYPPAGPYSAPPSMMQGPRSAPGGAPFGEVTPYPNAAPGPWLPLAPPAPPPSFWQRFLAWTGLRSR